MLVWPSAVVFFSKTSVSKKNNSLNLDQDQARHLQRLSIGDISRQQELKQAWVSER